MFDDAAVSLSCSGGGCVHSELPHGALLQVLLFPVCDVSLQSQDPLFSLSQLLLLLYRHHGAQIRGQGARTTSRAVGLTPWKEMEFKKNSNKHGVVLFCFVRLCLLYRLRGCQILHVKVDQKVSFYIPVLFNFGP